MLDIGCFLARFEVLGYDRDLKLFFARKLTIGDRYEHAQRIERRLSEISRTHSPKPTWRSVRRPFHLSAGCTATAAAFINRYGRHGHDGQARHRPTDAITLDRPSKRQYPLTLSGTLNGRDG